MVTAQHQNKIFNKEEANRTARQRSIEEQTKLYVIRDTADNFYTIDADCDVRSYETIIAIYKEGKEVNE